MTQGIGEVRRFETTQDPSYSTHGERRSIVTDDGLRLFRPRDLEWFGEKDLSSHSKDRCLWNRCPESVSVFGQSVYLGITWMI